MTQTSNLKNSGLVSVLILLFLTASSMASPVRITGSAGIKAYAYQDQNLDDHLWLFQNSRLSVYKIKSPWSLHFTGGYLGDNYDDFSNSGRTRFTRGYVEYGRSFSKLNLRLGRFFIYQGPAIGVLDGFRSQMQLSKGKQINVFAGLLGPISRDFLLEKSEDGFSYGAEYAFNSRVPYAEFTRYSISYASLSRNDENFRQRVNLTSYQKINSNFKWYNIIGLRTTSSPLRRFISRLRYNDIKWNSLLELALLNSDVSDKSWFADYALGHKIRIRSSVDRWIIPDKLGLGFDAAVLLTENAGLRFGPTIRFKYAYAGYRFSAGDQARSEGPWAQAKIDLPWNFQVYAFGAQTTYEWESFDIESNEVFSFKSGFHWQYNGLGLNTEYQAFQSPELDYDYRVMSGIEWRFDFRDGQ